MAPVCAGRPLISLPGERLSARQARGVVAQRHRALHSPASAARWQNTAAVLPLPLGAPFSQLNCLAITSYRATDVVSP